MIKLSVSQAARKLGISRREIQRAINKGKLDSHEGYVTADSVRLAYPNSNFHSEQDEHLVRVRKIRSEAQRKNEMIELTRSENEKTLMALVDSLKEKLNRETLKNQHYALSFNELLERLNELEHHCHHADKKPLHDLQIWMRTRIRRLGA